LGLLPRLAWAKERRVCQAVRIFDGSRTLLVANLHATSYPPDERLADAELLRAFVYVDGLAQPDEPVAVAGDFNVTFERSQTLLDLDQGRSGKPYIEEMQHARATLRGAIADLLAAAPERVSLTTSTTDGCNIVLGGLALRPEDEIVTTDAEHFGLAGPVFAS